MALIGRSEEKSDEDIVSEINITPLTDIFLVLLIIFMITSSALIESGAKVNLPRASQTTEEPRAIVVTVTDRNEISVNGKKISEQELQSALEKELAKSTDKTVIFEGDKNVLLGEAVRVLDMAKRAGAEKISIAAEKAQGSP
ncbi:MAG TPA: biopolymer transporter ExbD [Thermodesulfobacteriota bacterium]|jgi:biopolymer transport protein ExbD